MTKKEVKWFSYINLALWSFGFFYCVHHLFIGSNPISFLAAVVFAGLIIMEIVKIKRRRNND
ncbi:membrane protein [Arthrobacter phage Qui]|uniref:Membrane protein n=1 Tax=Arthrobacter phage Qui TaxID=2603260 RepID=A0A5B8WHB8_9CAUD|nr:membrane protein [Arthrobacter phage Qui]QED11701.1 membrane protein [Arthrobacter phage Qui]QOC56532.1 membrane protein [Arthrobacter phage Paella]